MSADRPLPTLRQVLANVHFRVTLFAVGLAGITVLLTGIVAVRGYANHNLQLVAQSASYTVEAALVFGDTVAAAEGIAPLAAKEDVAALAVYDTNGRLMAGWRRNGDGAGAMVERGMAAIMFPAPISATIRHQGAAVGEVRLRGDARGLIRFIECGLAGMLACLLITAIASYFLARRLQQKVVAERHREHRPFGPCAPRLRVACAACGDRRDRFPGAGFQRAARRARNVAGAYPLGA